MTKNKKILMPTHGMVHKGFRDFRAFVARKKSRCKLISFRLVIPHDTIPSNVVSNFNSVFEVYAFYFQNNKGIFI